MVKLFQGILGQVLGQIMGGFILMQSGLFTGDVDYFEIFRVKFMIFYTILYFIYLFLIILFIKNIP